MLYNGKLIFDNGDKYYLTDEYGITEIDRNSVIISEAGKIDGYTGQLIYDLYDKIHKYRKCCEDR